MREEELKALVARVTESVVAEVNKAEIERGISVSQLREEARGLGGGNLSQAWKITYDTSSKINDVAWKITYDTASKVLDSPSITNPAQ